MRLYNNDIGFEPPVDPPEKQMPVCPWCDAETDTFYRDRDGDICGCENCVKMVDAWALWDQRVGIVKR